MSPARPPRSRGGDRLGRRLRELAARGKQRLSSDASPAPSIIGVVDTFDRRRVVGSVTVPRGSQPVRIELFLNNIPIAATSVAMASEPGPDGDDEVRRFRFALRDVWRFARTSDRLLVKADGQPLPIGVDGRRYVTPEESGPRAPARLRQRMAHGYVFDQHGRLRLSKKVDTDWQQQVMRLFGDVRQLVKDKLDRELFFIYGTLLGAVREGGFIGHDIDLDTAFICAATDGPAAAAEMRDLAFALVDAGYVVESFRTHLHVSDGAGTRIDVFHLYFDAAGQLRLPFGIAGTTTISESDWRGVEEIDFPGGRGIVPVNKEQLVEHLYGADWRSPKPGFHWPVDRTTRAAEGALPRETHEEIYWANFYAHTHYDQGSTFFEFVNGRDDTPNTVIDIGCGDGRDSFAFGAAGRAVLGLDRSHIAVVYAEKKAEQMGLGNRVRFRAVDVSDTETLSAALRDVIAGSPDAPVLFYLRFFLHSIPQEVQEALLEVIDACARPNDVLAAEFRTDQDQARTKVHHKHYRRYQNGPAFGATLRERYRCQVLHEEEGTGLSPYRGEDPVLYRVIARRD